MYIYTHSVLLYIDLQPWQARERDQNKYMYVLFRLCVCIHICIHTLLCCIYTCSHGRHASAIRINIWMCYFVCMCVYIHSAIRINICICYFVCVCVYIQIYTHPVLLYIHLQPWQAREYDQNKCMYLLFRLCVCIHIHMYTHSIMLYIHLQPWQAR